jgi:hypothetical protein
MSQLQKELYKPLSLEYKQIGTTPAFCQPHLSLPVGSNHCNFGTTGQMMIARPVVGLEKQPIDR